VVGALTALPGLAFVALLVWLPGWTVGRRVAATDGFARVLWGTSTLSVVGLVLARLESFSLAALAAGVGIASVALAVAGHLRPDTWEARNPRHPDTARGRTGRRIAAAAGLATVLWCWPPFETVLGASDSTMYVNAGIHLARSGSLFVRGTAASVLGEQTATVIFASVRADGAGPFVRLPGGLLAARVIDDVMVPAFFPLLPVWTGVATLVGGHEAAPAVAPLAAGLAVWAVTLFVAETAGTTAAVAAALLLLANFAFWWFGRFTMPEPLACAFLWGGLVMLRRRHYVSAGTMFGLASLARAETLLFVIGATALWAVWTRPGRTRLVGLALGFVPLALLAVAGLVVLPNHHLAYLWNDLILGALRVGTDSSTGGALPAIGLIGLLGGAGLLLALRSGSFSDRALRVLSVLAVALASGLYLFAGGRSDPSRSLLWLGAYCSWPVLVFAVAGTWVLWRDGDETARLAIILSGMALLIFTINPRVAGFHPWAIRRFVPVVIPGLIVGAAVAVAAVAERARGRRALAAALTLAALVLLEVRPVLAVRDRTYYAGGFDVVETVAETMPTDAIAVVDSLIADVQIQVPLWLARGRETVMMRGATVTWRAAMYALVASGRPTYWLNHHLGEPPPLPGLRFEIVPPAQEIKLLLPDAPPNGPPARMIAHRFPLRIYRVTATDDGAGERKS
jgi:hypothetical protein